MKVVRKYMDADGTGMERFYFPPRNMTLAQNIPFPKRNREYPPFFFLQYGTQPVSRCLPPDVWRRGIRRFFRSLFRHNYFQLTTVPYVLHAGGLTLLPAAFRGLSSSMLPLHFQEGWTVPNTGRCLAQEAHGAGQV